MPVSLDEMMQEIPPAKRAEIERDAAALADAYRRQGDRSRTETSGISLGTKVQTGQRCPESGVWRVEGLPTATMPITVDNRMPPYGGRAVVWELVQPLAA